jgi:hypothetical protein
VGQSLVMPTAEGITELKNQLFYLFHFKFPWYPVGIQQVHAMYHEEKNYMGHFNK